MHIEPRFGPNAADESVRGLASAICPKMRDGVPVKVPRPVALAKDGRPDHTAIHLLPSDLCDRRPFALARSNNRANLVCAVRTS
jgi:hypothetical protein